MLVLEKIHNSILDENNTQDFIQVFANHLLRAIEEMDLKDSSMASILQIDVTPWEIRTFIFCIRSAELNLQKVLDNYELTIYSKIGETI